MSGVWTHAVLSLADLKPAALDHSAIIAYFYLFLFDFFCFLLVNSYEYFIVSF